MTVKKTKVLSLLLAVIMVFSIMPTTVFAEGYAGYFCLVAESNDKLIIEPTRVYYHDKETVGDALKASGHSFKGIDSGFITGIDGVDYTPNRMSDNGLYKFDEPASAVKVFRFSMSDSKPDTELVSLIQVMAEYNSNWEAKENAGVSAVYDSAKSAYLGISKADAKINADLLLEALDNMPVQDKVLTEIKVSNDGAQVSVTTESGINIPAESDGRYALIKGHKYVCTASKNCNDARYSFVAGDDRSVINLTLPENYNWLSEVAFGMAAVANQKGSYSLSQDFDPKVHEYNISIPENKYLLFAWASLNDAASLPSDAKITLKYTKALDGSKASVDITSGNAKGVNCVGLMANNAPSKPFEIHVSYEQSDVTYTQSYKFTPLNTETTLKTLNISYDGLKAAMTPAFNSSVKNYEVEVPTSAKQIEITAIGLQNYYEIEVNGNPVSDDGTIVLSADDIVGDEISVKAINPVYKTGSTYTIKLNKVAVNEVTVITEPKDAVVFLEDEIGNRFFAGENGKYKLLNGKTYYYSITKNGYVGKSGSFDATESSYSFTLDKAEVNQAIKPDISAAWSDFRGDGTNNGVVDKKTPNNADETTLYWATKCGQGYAWGAAGSPIIVNDYLVFCSSTDLCRMNRFTGEIDQTVKGKMVGTSNFNIIPPVYSDGIIFVGLSNGRIQAFNADTLESLWVYQDKLKGQPNSPMVVHDGYLYTGFWNSETKDANFVCLSIADEDPVKTDESKTATWTHTQQGGFYWSGAYACDDFVLVGTDDGEQGYLSDTSHLLSFEPKTGKIIDHIDNLNGDIRSSVCYDKVTDRYYFTTKGGSFYSAAVNKDGTFKKDANGVQGYDLKEILLQNYSDDVTNPAMSTSTPVVYNGRAYVGVSGTSQFGAYSGHNITVIDLENWNIAYKVRTKGYPQTSGLLTKGYQDKDGYSYVYFIDNYTPGQVRVIKDKPGVTSVVDPVTEVVNSGGKTITYDDCAPVLFTPSGSQAQYAICSPICDEYGTMYFKNDSAHMMALGSKIQKIQVENQPDKTVYSENEEFDAKGMKVVAYYANGLTRDITKEVTLSDNAKSLGSDDTDVTIYFNTVMYGDVFDPVNGNKAGEKCQPPETYVNVAVLTQEKADKVNHVIDLIRAIGDVTIDSEQAIKDARQAFDLLDEDLQDLVNNLDILTADEGILAGLKGNIKEVEDLISDIGDVTYAKKAKIEAAAAGFNALSDDLKSRIKNADVLRDAEKALEQLIKNIDAVDESINEIGTVTLKSEQAIKAAREAYNALPEESKNGVKGAEVLASAEKAYADLLSAIEKTEKLIDEIGEVTLKSESAINAANKAYNALSQEQQERVGNADVLKAAIEKLAELKKTATSQAEGDSSSSNANSETSSAESSLSSSSANSEASSSQSNSSSATDNSASKNGSSSSSINQNNSASGNNYNQNSPDTGNTDVMSWTILGLIALSLLAMAFGRTRLNNKTKD